MDTMIEFLMNSNGAYDLGSMIKMLGLMIAIDGIIMTIYAIVRGFNGK